MTRDIQNLCLYCAQPYTLGAVYCGNCGRPIATVEDKTTIQLSRYTPAKPFPPLSPTIPVASRQPYWTTHKIIVWSATTFLLLLFVGFGLFSVAYNLGRNSIQSANSPTSNPRTAPTNGNTPMSNTTPSLTPTNTPIPTPSAVPSYKVGTIICHPSWANGLKDWSVTPDWFVQDGMLLNNGQGAENETPSLIPPCQSQLANIRDYSIVVKMQILHSLSQDACFGINIRGITTSDGWHGYDADMEVHCRFYANAIFIHGTSSDTRSQTFVPNMDVNTYTVEAKGYHITYKIDGITMVSVDDLNYVSGTDIGLHSNGFQLKISDIEIIVI